VVTIHVGGADGVREYLRSNHLEMTALADADGAAAQAYHVSGVPKLVLIGVDGKIKRTTAGFADESVLQEWMDLVRPS